MPHQITKALWQWQGWIELSSASWGVVQPKSAVVSTGGGTRLNAASTGPCCGPSSGLFFTDLDAALLHGQDDPQG